MKREYGKVSIILPVYNGEKYIRKCLNSIINQTYTDLEVIIIDDGSEDKSYEICKEYEKQNSCIKVLHQNNAGPGIARNKGLEYVTGEFLTYIDSDDYISTEAIYKMVSKIEEFSADIIEVGTVFMLPRGNKYVDCNRKCYCIDGYRELVSDYFKKNHKLRNTLWGRMYRFEKICDIRFSEKRIGEDSEYSLKVLASCDRFLKYNECLYAYRGYNGSITRNKEKHYNFDVIDISLCDMKFCESLDYKLCDWTQVISNFEKKCYSLLIKVAIDKEENSISNEIQNMIHICNDVEEIAKRHDVFFSNKLLSDLQDIHNWSEKYRKNNSIIIIKNKFKQRIYKLMAQYKTKRNYEYKFK